jgi:hypothetical protein
MTTRKARAGTKADPSLQQILHCVQDDKVLGKMGVRKRTPVLLFGQVMGWVRCGLGGFMGCFVDADVHTEFYCLRGCGGLRWLA